MSKIPRDAYLLIIGAMKSGTSSLFHYLLQHPQICPASDKEPEYFLKAQNHAEPIDSYSDLWDFDPAVHRYAMEASTGYTKAPSESGVPERISADKIQPKFIYIMRDPIQRIESHYNFSKSYHAGDLSIDSPYLVTLSDYYYQLSQYRDYFPKEDFLLIDFDSFTTNPRDTLRTVYRFLGLESPRLPEDFSVKNATQLENPILARISRSSLRFPIKLIPRGLRLKIRDQLRKHLKKEDYTRLSDPQKETIKKRLRENMIKLKTEYGFDTTRWGF